MKNLMKNLRTTLVLALAFGCGSDDDGGGGGAESEGELAMVDLSAIPEECNPLVGDDCITPYPSSLYLEADADTATGLRMALPAEILPVNVDGVALDPAPLLNTGDGFPAATYMVAYFAQGIDASILPPIDDLAASMAKGSPTIVVDVATGERVPHFAELDANADPERCNEPGETPEEQCERQGLIIRPVVRLKGGTRYAVGLTRALGPATPPGFQAILDGAPTNHAGLERLRGGYDSIFAALAKAGVARDDLLLAWDFTTGSDERLTGATQAMVEEGLAAVPTMDYTIDDDGIEEPEDDENVFRIVKGTFKVPNFMDDDGRIADPPVSDGVYEAEFTVLIPRVADESDAPLPTLLFGHGLFGAGREYIDTIPIFDAWANDNAHVMAATDWIGLHAGDQPDVTHGLTNINAVYATTDKLRQAIVNAAVLARLVRDRFRTDENFQIDGREVIDDTTIHYWGISLGGIMGGSLAAYSPDIERFALGVPGGNWAMMIQRSSNWPEFGLTLYGSYTDRLDNIVLLAMFQTGFEFSDPYTTAPRVLSDPLPGVGEKRILMYEAVGDSQVPNIATETVARTMGIPLLAPPVHGVFGLEERKGPVDSAIVLYDLDLEPAPSTSNAGSGADNGSHGLTNIQPAVHRQIRALFEEGTIENTCDGACRCYANDCN
ncbi:MAG: hypothetical protein AABZ30_04530 [Myxococcota bacterium]